MTRRDGSHPAYVTLAAAVAWFGLALQLAVTWHLGVARGKNLFVLTGQYFSYFTILTNLGVALALTLRGHPSRLGRFYSRPSVQTGLAVAIALVAVGYNLLLRQLWHPRGLVRVADETLHVVTPALYLVFWWLFVPKGVLRWSEVPQWLLYPLLYVLYALLLGALSGFYPYYFLDAQELGYLNVLGYVVGFAVAVLALSFSFVALDHAFGRRLPRPR